MQRRMVTSFFRAISRHSGFGSMFRAKIMAGILKENSSSNAVSRRSCESVSI